MHLSLLSRLLTFFLCLVFSLCLSLSTACSADTEVSSENESEEAEQGQASSTPGTVFAPGQGATPFIEGHDFIRLSKHIQDNPTVKQFIARDPGKVQVIEFFNYGCYWCSHLYPDLRVWEQEKPDYVVFYQFPMLLHNEWKIYSMAYYVVRDLGLNHEAEINFDRDFFVAIHQKQQTLMQKSDMVKFFNDHGITEKQFLDLFKSQRVHDQLTYANNLSLAYQISISPALVVNTSRGSFLCATPYVGSQERLMQLLKYLTLRYAPHNG